MKCQRLFVSDVAEMTGLHPATVRSLANKGLIKSQRDWNGWRIFSPEALEIAKKLAGVNRELPNVEAGREKKDKAIA